MKTVIKLASGGVAIMTLVNDADEAKAIEKWQAVNPGAYISHRQMPDSAIPPDKSLRHLWTDTTPELVIDIPPAAILLKLNKAAFILQIDADTDSLIRSVIGERGSEYELAEKEAAAFQAAGYPVTVPSSVSAWATAKGWTAKAAADSIIATAANWRSAQSTLRAARLLRKEQARTAVDAAALDVVMAQWAAFLAALKAQLTEA